MIYSNNFLTIIILNVLIIEKSSFAVVLASVFLLGFNHNWFFFNQRSLDKLEQGGGGNYLPKLVPIRIFQWHFLSR